MSEITKKLKYFLTAEEVSLSDVKELFTGIFSAFWAKRMKMLIIILIPVLFFLALGILAALTSPKEYEAKVVLLTDQVASAGSGSLQGLASLAGINLPGGGGGGDGMGADLYPLILANRPFLIDFSRQPIKLSDTAKGMVTLEKYFQKEPKTDYVTKLKKQLANFPTTVKSWVSGNKSDQKINDIPFFTITDTALSQKLNESSFTNEAFVAELNAGDKRIITNLTARIKLTQVGKLITLAVKMPEARLSAEATKSVLNLLIKYVTRFKLGKQLETLHFLEDRTAEAEIKYKESQQRLAGFKDNNYGVIYQSVQSKEAQLQNEFNLTFTIYNQLVSQLEQAKIQLKKDTPLFTVIEPVYIPEGSMPDTGKIIFSYVGIGFAFGILAVLGWLLFPVFFARKKTLVID
jgi:uncharacterized protein involved in exopolysaccharide biosynthesis